MPAITHGSHSSIAFMLAASVATFASQMQQLLFLCAELALACVGSAMLLQRGHFTWISSHVKRNSARPGLLPLPEYRSALSDSRLRGEKLGADLTTTREPAAMAISDGIIMSASTPVQRSEKQHQSKILQTQHT